MEPKTNSKEELTSYLNSIVILLLSVLFIGLPILFVTFTTDFFSLPKQALAGTVVLISLIIFVFKTIIERDFRLRRTIFDLPLVLLILSASLSSFFAVNRSDSLITLVTFLFAAFSFFVIVNFVRKINSFFWLIATLGAGAAFASIISILSYLKVYILPFPFTQTPTFTPLGALMDQAVYLIILLPIAIFFVRKKSSQVEQTVNYEGAQAQSPVPSGTGQSERSVLKMATATVVLIILFIGFSITAYQLFNPTTGSGQKLTILPYQYGFQTAFAAISQDTQRSVQGFLFGSGYGTFLTDFTRFKQALINQDSTLWSLVFIRSSSFALELLATTGILGILSFIFLTLRTIKILLARGTLFTNPISISLMLSIIALFVLPVGFTIIVLFFILLAMFSVFQGFNREEQKSFFDIELQLVALKKGLFNLETFTTPFASTLPSAHQDQKNKSRILPVIFGVTILSLVGSLGYFGIRYLISDIEFQSSLVAASENQAQQTYQKQNNAILIFPYRDGYYRVFSQSNLALANSLAIQQSQAASPSADTQRTIYTLIQQSINAGRTATSIAPLTSLNWQNLSSIYRSLIGFGQNAENFAVVTQQQAILLDPNNPQGYIVLGGIYYQLGLWENAQNQFQIALNLKPDFPNGRYNLGHALESKGDLVNALIEYEKVKNLVADDQNSLAIISREIEVIQNKIKEGETASIPPSTTPPLNLSTPSAQLPPQTPPVEIPAPEEVATGSAQ